MHGLHHHHHHHSVAIIVETDTDRARSTGYRCPAPARRGKIQGSIVTPIFLLLLIDYSCLSTIRYDPAAAQPEYYTPNQVADQY